MADVLEIKNQIVRTGQILLENKLVARTWGNTSARLDEEYFAISPSGLDYLLTEPEDIVVMKLCDLSWEGERKPSSEKGIHAAAYEVFPEVNFVIHTHQKYASALGLGGFDQDQLTEEEREVLGDITTADYGLPGTKKLAGYVTEKFQEGSKIVFMKHHGVVICGTDMEDALKKAILLEEVCKKQIQGMDVSKPASIQFAKLGIPLTAQLDDMAQMIGKKIPVVSQQKFSKKLIEKHGVLIVEDKGIGIYAEDPEDKDALRILTEKAAAAALHTRALGIKGQIPAVDARLMRTVYQLKYSKQKKG